jgi:hypothetical protein
VKTVIVKTRSGSNPSYEMSGYGNRSKAGAYALSSGTRNNNSVFAKRERDIEASSEEGILPMKGVDMEKSKTIVKTTAVSVKYEAERGNKDKSSNTTSWIN